MEHAWFAWRDDDAQAALECEHLHTRPASEPVPRAMQGTVLGTIYARLARRTDGETHRRLRQVTERLLSGWDDEAVRRFTREAVERVRPQQIAPYVVASLIGIDSPQDALPSIHDFATAIADGASDDAVARGVAAAERLMQTLPHASDLDERANLLGFLFQSYAPTAVMIDNLVKGLHEPSVRITRRWADRDVEVNGAQLREGDPVVVSLIGERLHFGAGAHACPGRHIAELIATTAAAAMLGR